MRGLCRAAATAVIVGGVWAGVRATGVVASPSPTVLAVPNRASAHVSLASRDRVVAAVWFASTAAGPGDIFAAVSQDAGVTFGVPVRVNSTVGAARVNGEQPPRVTLVPRAGQAVPDIAVIWTAKTERGTALLTSRSVDGGRTFAAALPMPGTETAGNRGWEAMASGADGRVYAVWLDHRRLSPPEGEAAPAAHRHGGASATAAAGHDHAAHAGHAAAAATPAASAADGIGMAEKSDLYFAEIDGGAPRPVTSGVCYCCKTAVAVGPNGEIYLAWRHVYPGNFRDISVSVSRDRGATFTSPARVSQDNWMLTGCPDDGPSMQVDRGGRLHVVWPAVVTEAGGPVKALFYANSVDGRVFSPRVRIPTSGQANHPYLAVAGAGLLVTWDESGDGSRRIVQARGTVDPAGRVTFARAPLGGEIGVYPNAVAVASGTVTAWTSGPPDASVVKIARTPIP